MDKKFILILLCLGAILINGCFSSLQINDEIINDSNDDSNIVDKEPHPQIRDESLDYWGFLEEDYERFGLEKPPQISDKDFRCDSDDDCELFNKEEIFSCCHSCFPRIDYSEDKWVAVNKEFLGKYSIYKNKLCLDPDLRVCPDMMPSPPEIINDQFEARCVIVFAPNLKSLNKCFLVKIFASRSCTRNQLKILQCF